MNVHGTGIVLDGRGVMLRGPSGSGKSLLALILMEAWIARGLEAILVADDRLDLTTAHGAVTMEAPSAIRGLIELRGRGILSRPYRVEARVDLVVDLVETLDRMPEDAAFSTDLLGVSLSRCPVPRIGLIDTAHHVLLVREALSDASTTGAKTS